jgi:hypothetical protein
VLTLAYCCVLLSHQKVERRIPDKVEVSSADFSDVCTLGCLFVAAVAVLLLTLFLMMQH